MGACLASSRRRLGGELAGFAGQRGLRDISAFEAEFGQFWLGFAGQRMIAALDLEAFARAGQEFGEESRRNKGSPFAAGSAGCQAKSGHLSFPYVPERPAP